METPKAIRASYAQASDEDLRAILNAGTTHLSIEARQALMAEVAHRRMLADVNPLDTLAWPAEVPERPRYTKVKFGRRLSAHVLDVLIAGLPYLGIVLVGLLGRASAVVGALAAMGGGVSWLWALYYIFTKDGRPGGQSIGKKKLNLMVVNVATSKPCTKRESFLRQLDLVFLSMFPIVGWLVEPVFIFTSDDGRRLGDRLAGTQVIDVNEYQPSVR